MAVVGGQVLTKMAGTTWLSRMNLSLLFTSSHACNSLKDRSVFTSFDYSHTQCFAVTTFVSLTLWFMCNISMQESLAYFPPECSLPKLKFLYHLPYLQFRGGFPPG